MIGEEYTGDLRCFKKNTSGEGIKLMPRLAVAERTYILSVKPLIVDTPFPGKQCNDLSGL